MGNSDRRENDGSKVRMNHTFDPVNAEYLREQDNASALLNRLVENYREGYGAEDVIIDYRLEELQARISEQESRTESMRERYSELQSRKERNRDRDMDVVREFIEHASETVDLSEDSPPIQNWSDETSYTPAEFSEKVQEYWGEFDE